MLLANQRSGGPFYLATDMAIFIDVGGYTCVGDGRRNLCKL
jgi:hypothetical protein